MTDLRGINKLTGRLGTSNYDFKLFRRPLLLACSCRFVIGTVFPVLGTFSRAFHRRLVAMICSR